MLSSNLHYIFYSTSHKSPQMSTARRQLDKYVPNVHTHITHPELIGRTWKNSVLQFKFTMFYFISSLSMSSREFLIWNKSILNREKRNDVSGYGSRGGGGCEAGCDWLDSAKQRNDMSYPSTNFSCNLVWIGKREKCCQCFFSLHIEFAKVESHERRVILWWKTHIFFSN